MGFPGEGKGLFKPAKDWDGSQRYTVLYGQGLSVNALQADRASSRPSPTTACASPRGSSRQSVTARAGSRRAAEQPKPVRVVSPDTAKQLRDMLEGVVGKEGTAPEAKIEGYRVAGKTGTADRYDPKVGGYSGKTASFIGFAPADDPQVVVSVTLQRPIKGYFGGVVAGPVFRDVMTYALQELRDPPDQHDARRRSRSRPPRTPSPRRHRPCSATPSLTTSAAGEAGSLLLRVIPPSPRPRPCTRPRCPRVADLVGAPAPAADVDGHRGHPQLAGRRAGGDLYAALPGANAHGAAYAAGAVEAGAVAVLTDPSGAALLDLRPRARAPRVC